MSFGLRQSFGRICKAEMAEQIRMDLESEGQEFILDLIKGIEDLGNLLEWQPDPQYRLH